MIQVSRRGLPCFNFASSIFDEKFLGNRDDLPTLLHLGEAFSRNDTMTPCYLPRVALATVTSVLQRGIAQQGEYQSTLIACLHALGRKP